MEDALGRVDLALDWSVEPLLLGGFRWRAKRPDQCDLVVELRNQGRTWGVEVFTENKNGPRRAKGKKENWRSGLSYDDSLAQLTDVFEALLQ